jgi:hypothetical protein
VQVLEELKERLPDEAKRGIERALEQQKRIAPGRSDERKKDTEKDREAERPRASETPRGGRPSATPPRAPSR